MLVINLVCNKFVEAFVNLNLMRFNLNSIRFWFSQRPQRAFPKLSPTVVNFYRCISASSGQHPPWRLCKCSLASFLPLASCLFWSYLSIGLNCWPYRIFLFFDRILHFFATTYIKTTLGKRCLSGSLFTIQKCFIVRLEIWVGPKMICERVWDQVLENHWKKWERIDWYWPKMSEKDDTYQEKLWLVWLDLEPSSIWILFLFFLLLLTFPPFNFEGNWITQQSSSWVQEIAKDERRYTIKIVTPCSQKDYIFWILRGR